MNYIYFAIQLPCDPEFDYNIGFASKEKILDAMKFNYGKEFHFVEKGKDIRGDAIIYVQDEKNRDYARVVKIRVVD